MTLRDDQPDWNDLLWLADGSLCIWLIGDEGSPLANGLRSICCDTALRRTDVLVGISLASC